MPLEVSHEGDTVSEFVAAKDALLAAGMLTGTGALAGMLVAEDNPVIVLYKSNTS